MGRSELERLSREELIELVLRLQRPEKTSRTSIRQATALTLNQFAGSGPGSCGSGSCRGGAPARRTPTVLADNVARPSVIALLAFPRPR
jgi:hypothetical protein